MITGVTNPLIFLDSHSDKTEAAFSENGFLSKKKSRITSVSIKTLSS
jgi:hypothetical protein